MKASFRYLWQFTWPNLGIIAALAGALTLLTAWQGGGELGSGSFFGTYFGMFPLMALLIIFLLSTTLTSACLDMAVSFGGLRRDFFWALQGSMAAYTLTCWGLQKLLAQVPVLLNWANREDWQMLLNLGEQPWWWYPLTCMTAFGAGSLCAMLMARSRVLGVLALAAVCLFGVASVVFLMLTTFNDFHLWGDLPWLIPLLMAVVFVGCEVLLRRYIHRYCVR